MATATMSYEGYYHDIGIEKGSCLWTAEELKVSALMGLISLYTSPKIVWSQTLQQPLWHLISSTYTSLAPLCQSYRHEDL